MTDGDLSAIRSRYLGVDKKKRKIRKMSDRKFVFDWDDQDDTFNDVASAASALASIPGLSKSAGAVMFGRGHLAGMDDGGVQEATKANRQHADAIERRRATKGGGDERHWSEKKLEEMKDRDWRIFREDFSIATRGLCHGAEHSPRGLC
jgi:ATP-dependent RNA helicase DDX23/PRP28